MDFTPSETQRELAELTRRIVTDRVTAELLKAVDETGERFDRDLWRTLTETGLRDPELTLADQCSILIELGRALAPVPYLPTVVCAAALTQFGSAAQNSQWSGKVLTFALTDSDYAVRRTTAPRLTGEVTTVPAGTVAEAFLVETGSGTFVVLPGDPGVTIERQHMTDNDDAALLRLSAVPLAEDRRLEVPPGFLRDRATVALCAYQLGVLQQALDLTAEHARTRVQFGRPIGAFQAVSQRVANAYVDVQALELTLWNAVWLLEHPGDGDADAAVATAKFWAADAGHRVAHTAVHLHGGTGIDLDHTVHRYFTTAKRIEFSLGAATEQLLRLASTHELSLGCLQR